MSGAKTGCGSSLKQRLNFYDNMISFAERTKPRPPFRLERLKRASVYICFLLASPILQSYLQNSLTRLLRLHNMRYYETEISRGRRACHGTSASDCRNVSLCQTRMRLAP